jgi:hypothetical protein
LLDGSGLEHAGRGHRADHDDVDLEAHRGLHAPYKRGIYGKPEPRT